MKKLLVCLTVLASSLISCPFARAQDCQLITNAKPDATCLVFYHQNRRGLWFSEERALQLKQSYELVPELKIVIAKHAEAASLYEREAATERMIRDSLKLEIDKLERALVASESRANECLEDQGSWLSSPVLWAIVGFLAGTTVVGVVSAAN